MSRQAVQMWIVIYKVSGESNWCIRRDLVGQGHASDVASQMVAEGYFVAHALPAQLVFEIPEPAAKADIEPVAEELPPAEAKAEDK